MWFWNRKKRDPPEVIAARKKAFYEKEEKEAREMAQRAMEEKLKLARDLANQCKGSVGSARIDAIFFLALTIQESTDRIVKELDRIGDRCGRYPSGHCGPL